MFLESFDLTSEAVLDRSLEGLFGLGGALLAIAIILLLIGLAVVVLIVVANCRLFVKAGEKWWKGLIPLYNNWVETKIGGLAWWWFLIFVVLTGLITTSTSNASLTGEVYSISSSTNYVWGLALCLVQFNYNYNICKKFGKSNSFAFWLTVLPVVFLPILAFGSAKYNKNAEVDENGVFSIKK